MALICLCMWAGLHEDLFCMSGKIACGANCLLVIEDFFGKGNKREG
jgi:hypothetical protein